LNVQINDYQAPNRTFYAPDRPPTLPAQVSADVQWISGLDSDSQIHTFSHKSPAVSQLPGNKAPTNSPPYVPQDFRAAYDTNPLLNAGYTGAGTVVAITLWTLAPSDGQLMSWSSQTGASVATRGNGRLVEVFTDGGPSSDPDDGEAALDIESVSGMAPGATIAYYEATQPQNSNLAVALDVAGSNPDIHIISNSWGAPETTSGRNAMESIFASHSASGHGYFFSSGDDGSWANGSDPYPNYPTSSVYVTSVGGTAFAGDINGNYPGETTWVYNPTGNNGHPEGSGGGFSRVAPRPSWQNAPGFPNVTVRGYPDIAADADPNTGAFICTDYNGCIQIGGTSLAAPLWSGMWDLVDQYLVANGKPHLGFLAPWVYTMASSSLPYAAFHDITSGTNGAYDAAAGWDPVTGIGSPDLANFALDLLALQGGPAATPTPQVTPTFVPGQIFSDVPPSNPFYTPINWCYDQGLISGYGNPDGTKRFQPNSSATRAQVSKMIFLAAGWAVDTGGGPHFTDVPPANPFYNYIETAYNHGVISGYADHTFRPNNNITRAQFSKVLVLTKAWAIDTTGGPHFTDVPTTNAFYGVVETAYNHGVISGYGDHTFRPNSNITRAQLAKLLYGAYGP
jgi:kumamolisin